MRIKDGFVLRKFLDKWVAVYVGVPSGHPGMVTMNKTGAFLWEKLQRPTTREHLLQAMLEHYDVSETIAREQLERFLGMLEAKKLLEK